MEIFINDKWICFDSSKIKIEKLIQRKHVYYDEVRINCFNRIKFLCEKCGNIFESTSRLYYDNIENFSEICNVCKKNNTMMTNFGTTSNFIVGKESTKKTNLERYGVENPFQSEQIKEKIKEINFDKYGVEYTAKNKEIKEKIRITQNKNHGSYAFCTEKQKKTMINRYGAEYALQNKQILEKTIKTKQNKYSNLNNYEKIKSTNLIKYGVDNPWKSKQIIEELRLKTLSDFYKNLITSDRLKNLVTPLFSIEEYRGVYKNKYLWQCNHCEHKFISRIDNCAVPRCPICFPKYGLASKLEKEVADYVKSLELRVEENNRTLISPLELDIYIKEYNLAIEFNGTYWHSSRVKSRWYHQMKVDKCDRLGIRLLPIYEWEWVNNRQLCIDKINYYITHHDRIQSRKPIKRFVLNNKEVFEHIENTLTIWD